MRKPRSDKGVPRRKYSNNDSRMYAFRLYDNPARDWFDRETQALAEEQGIPYASAIREVIQNLIYTAYPDLGHYQQSAGHYTTTELDTLRDQLDELREQFRQYIEANKNRVNIHAVSSDSPEIGVDWVGEDLINNIMEGMGR